MLSRIAIAALIHIRFNIILVGDFIRGMDHAGFEEDLKTFYATTRALEIISEASRRLPDQLKDRHPFIPWREMRDAGNIYRHGYEEVAISTVWSTAVHRLAPLLAVVEEELSIVDREQEEGGE